MNTREISKNPEVPILSERAVELLTKLCFREEDMLRESDLLFIFGTSFGIADIADAAAFVLTRQLVRKVIIAGGAAAFPDTPNLGQTEAMEIYKTIDPDRFPTVAFRMENDSHNTRDNVKFSLRFPEMAAARRTIFLFRSHACGRGFLTLRKFLPTTELLQLPVDACYQEGAPKITREGWSKHMLSRSRVWGEFLRIEKYGTRGDIYYPHEMQALADKIKDETTRA